MALRKKTKNISPETEEVLKKADKAVKKLKDSVKKLKKEKKKETSAADKFENELDSFLNKTKGIQVAELGGREQAPYYIDSGNYALNWVVSDDFFKGIPGTKAIRVAGESGMGKSLICDQFLGNNIKLNNGISFKVEIEDAGGREFTAAIVGSQEVADKIKIIEPVEDEKGNFKPITIEKLTGFFNKLVQFQIGKKSKAQVMVVVDSISQITSDKEFEDVQKDKDTRDMTVQQKMRAFFRVLTQQQRQANLTIIGIAHVTANIGVMFGPKTVINSKGSGFKYASSLDIEVKGNKPIKNKDITIGYKMKLTTSKNRMTFKGRSVWIDFYTYGGIDKYSGLCEILARYGVFKASAKPDVNGFFKDSVSFTWKDRKFKENQLESVLKELGEETALKEIQQELNDRFQALCKRERITEDMILEDNSENEEIEDEFLEGQLEE